MKNRKRSSFSTPGYVIAAISLLLLISGATLTYALASGRLSLQEPVVQISEVTSTEPPVAGLASATAEAGNIPVSGGPSIAGSSCLPESLPETGAVVEVLDGDTIRVRLDSDGGIYSVHYAGVDAPNSRTGLEYFGTEALIKNSELVSGQTVTLIKDISETDRLGQLSRYVLTDKLFVNYELVAQGYAYTLTDSPDISCISTFEAAEEQASIQRLGLWVTHGGPPCSCIGSDLQCLDFDTKKQAQVCFEYCQKQGHGDPFNLDYDGDGQACEQLPQ